MNAKDSNSANLPKTLVDAIRYFSDPAAALDFFVKIRWPNGVCCPHCGSTKVHFLAKQLRWKCGENHPRRQFTVKIGTVMEESPLGLDKWAVAFWLEVNAKNSISSYEVHRALGITQKSAWFMQHRIRLALKAKSFDKLTGEVESDESFFGGRAANMHRDRLLKLRLTGDKYMGKAIVHGLMQRTKKDKHSKVIAKVVHNVHKQTLCDTIRSAVQPGAFLYTDTSTSYKDLEEFAHYAVDHAERYVQGRVHTNGLENFWSLFKRCIKGTHVAIEPFHLAAYLDAEMFRFNNRKVKDGDRFALALQGMDGRRLTYKALIGALESTPGSGDSGGAGANPPN
jgi:transposase-like protein